ncbi:DUF4910 domain-containing protein [Hymenobacter busanensis]|uniref:DUF4910 domain-containing protein n=1 Tax=Hymenobacter busanensis TaxID=2607656 RepID=A0A7L4ZVJ4_9BACT|nr:DUF4910 domain-containing protein [Hymenobacter busanensis]KAA9339245.1 DUF4910 domain-containing protein [Hymenobacter busanensis]QHJ06993.1 DUF4910 domain-containing protein [Hymenobacter busanensis]
MWSPSDTPELAPPATRRPGAAMHQMLRELYPLGRSITGDGVRATLRVLATHLPAGLTAHEVPSGTQVLDWTVPPEWNIRDAYVRDAAGRRVIDFQQHNLHVVGYSTPVAGWFSRAELDEHLHSLPEQPDLIPYRTSYYSPAWGFCLAHHEREQLRDEQYEVCIDATLDPAGSLTYGQLVLPGSSDEEVLISCHICHPSLANDNLSGLVTAVGLANWLAERPRRYTYRFVFLPGTIGSITWLHEHRASAVPRIRHGLVLSLLGGPGHFTYKRSRQGAAAIDRAVALALRDAGTPHELRDFSPYGYDERQYCSPGFNLPVGCFTRTPFGEFPEYHTSADNPAFVRPRQLAQSLRLVKSLCRILEHNRSYQNLSPYGEPQLGRRGLYKNIGGGLEGQQWQLALLWVLNQSDGQHSLVDIAEKANLPFTLIRKAAKALRHAQLLAPA